MWAARRIAAILDPPATWADIWCQTGRTLSSPLLAALAYALAFAPLYRALGTGAVALASLPVIIVAAARGRAVGLTTALLFIPLVTALLNAWTPHRGALALFRDGGAPGTLALLVAAGVIGHLRDVQAALRREVAARAAVERDLRRLAFHDPLTGLPNRALFERRLDRALARDPAHVAVLLADLDNFKSVNDCHGHAAGDALLVAVAVRLREIAGPGATVARLGGDEFAVLLPGPDATRADAVAAALLAASAAPLMADGHTVQVGLSVGVAFGAPGRAIAAPLLRAADAALYRAKRAGKGSYAVEEGDT